MRVQRDTVTYLQDLDELVWTPEGHEAKKSECLHVCLHVCVPEEDTDDSHEEQP